MKGNKTLLSLCLVMLHCWAEDNWQLSFNSTCRKDKKQTKIMVWILIRSVIPNKWQAVFAQVLADSTKVHTAVLQRQVFHNKSLGLWISTCILYNSSCLYLVSWQSFQHCPDSLLKNKNVNLVVMLKNQSVIIIVCRINISLQETWQDFEK